MPDAVPRAEDATLRQSFIRVCREVEELAGRYPGRVLRTADLSC